MNALASKAARTPVHAAQLGRYHGLADQKMRLRALVTIENFGHAMIMLKGDGKAETIPCINPRKNETIPNAMKFEALLSESANAILKMEKNDLKELLEGIVTFAAAYRLDGANKVFVLDFKLIGKWRDGRKEGQNIRLIASASEDADPIAIEIFKGEREIQGTNKTCLSLKGKGNFI
jgi:hypothetical protein